MILSCFNQDLYICRTNLDKKEVPPTPVCVFWLLYSEITKHKGYAQSAGNFESATSYRA